MDFEQASAIGARGEARVSQMLQRLALRYSFRHLDGLLLKRGPMTAQLDHVVVDRQGIVIIESKTRTGALIRGNDVEKRWTAVYRSGAKKPFQNPLAQNREHENLVRQALRDHQPNLEPDYIESIVVFVDANITQLDLHSSARLRVLDIDQLERFFAARDAGATTRTLWSQEWIDYWANLLVWLDKSRDAATQQHHAEYRGNAPVAAAAQAPRTVPTNPAASRAAPASRPRIDRTRDSVGREATSCLMRVGLMLGLLATLWLCAASGAADWAIRGAISRAFPVRPSPQQTSPLVPQAPANPGLNLAKTRLRELAPNICAAATDLDNPSVSQSADETTYTWTYLTRPTPTSAVVQKFSLTLGPDGVMRHMGASK